LLPSTKLAYTEIEDELIYGRQEEIPNRKHAELADTRDVAHGMLGYIFYEVARSLSPDLQRGGHWRSKVKAEALLIAPIRSSHISIAPKLSLYSG